MSVSKVREFKVVTYTITNAQTPEFVLTQDGAYIAPTDPKVKAMADSADPKVKATPVFVVRGTISKSGEKKATLTIERLPISAEKYAHSAFSYADNADGSVITITLPDFKRGAGDKVRKYDATAKAVVGLRGLAPKVVAPVAPIVEAPKA